jgi:predicted nucleotidyltransferase
MSKTPQIGTGEALRRLGQISIDFTEACRDFYSAKGLLSKAQADWVKLNGYPCTVQGPLCPA